MADRLAERPAGNGADVLLELRDRGAVERPVAGIVHARRDLVDQHVRAAVLLDHEHLDREHADIIQGVGDLLRDRPRLCGEFVRDVGRRTRDFQNVVAVLVFGNVVAFDLTVDAARGDHRDFAFERYERLEDRGLGAEIVPDLIGIVALADDGLALAVIAEAAGLDYRGAGRGRGRRGAGFHPKFIRGGGGGRI